MIDKLRNTQIPILTKITLPYLILALLIAVGGSYLVTRVVIDSQEERFANQLIETGLLASESIVREEEELLENLRLVSHVQGIAQAVDADQIERIRELALPNAINSRVEALAILNRFGRELLVLELNDDQQDYGLLVPSERIALVEFVENVLRENEDDFGDKFSGSINTLGGDYLFVAGPIHDSRGTLVGVALVGKSQESLAQQVRAETLGQVSFYDLGGLLGTSTLAEVNPLSEEEANSVLAGQADGSLAREVIDSGITYKELLAPYELRGGEDIGIIGVALPTNFLVQSNQITRTNTIVLASSVLFLVILVGFLVANRITQPIKTLKEAAQLVSEGDLSVRVDQGSRDEIGVLASSFNEMLESVNKSKQDLIKAYDKTIEGWAMALDLRDAEMQGHSKRVSDLAVRLAKRMGMKGEELQHLRRGALLHDVGKIAIPDSILLKEDKLTPSEREKTNLHPIYGKEFMERIEFLDRAMDIPYSHHEKWDGTGYPQQLKGSKIPLATRIFSIVDVWDAITNDRPYRKAMQRRDALKIIRQGSGKDFDPEVARVFLALLEEDFAAKGNKGKGLKLKPSLK